MFDMINFIAFEKIAPFLKDPFIFIGFAIFLIVGLIWIVIQSGAIPVLTKKAGGEIVKKALNYIFILSLFIIIFGFIYKISKESESFDFTVFLENNIGESIVKSEGKLLLCIGNDKREEPVDQKGSVTFKQIPASLKNETVNLQMMEMDGWHFENEKKARKIMLKDIHSTVIIEPETCHVWGSVTDDKGKPLHGVKIWISRDSVFSNRFGEYSIAYLFQSENSLHAFKNNYKPYYLSTIQPGKLVIQLEEVDRR
jgi:hypothetical protein